jgi:RNA polymerase sigma-70 factor (ECF subfamily)
MNDRNMQGKLEAIHPYSFGWALACCSWNRDEAEEVLQASYLKALDGRAAFDGLSSLRTWFFGVVKRTAAERRRRTFRSALKLERWLLRRPEPIPEPTPETHSREAEDRRRLRRLLDYLTPRQRDLLHLVFYQELTIEEAAGVLDISLGTARTHYERGKTRLRGLLMGAEKDDEKSGRKDSKSVYVS